jgi:uncharacterized protein (TIGR03437 family)
VSWITISFGGVPGNPSTGNGSSGYRIQANRDAAPRSGTLTVAGQTVRVTQAAADCPLTLEPSAAVIAPAGASGSFRVRTTCNWTASSQNEWIRITTGTSGSGNGAVFYAVNANNTGLPRSGAIRAGSTLFAISQSATNCAVTIDPQLANVPAGGGSTTIRVASTCSWTAESQTPWIRVAGAAGGNGNGQVILAADPNNSLQQRTGVVQIGNQSLTVVQAAAACVIDTNPQQLDVPATGGSASIGVTSTCNWAASTVDSWLRIVSGSAGMGNGTVQLAVSPNSGDPRSGLVRIGTQTVPVRQAGGACQITLSPASGEVPSRGGGGSVLVAGGPDCSWSVSAPDWIEVTPGAGTGGAVLRYTVGPNHSGAARSGAFTVAGQSFTVRQPAASPTFTAAGIANAASFAGGLVAPGLIVTVFGSELGPDQLAPGELDETGTSFTSTLGGTRILFDGIPAPLLYASDRQVSAIVPFEAAGTTSVVVEARGSRSAPVAVPVAAAAPGIFTLQQSGLGPAAVLNQDFSVNGGNNRAATGSIIQIFATGGGRLDPLPANGSLVAGIARVTLPVTVEIGGRSAEVLYAGAAPGLVAGLLQVNARVPEDLLPGTSVPLLVRVGEVASQPGATIAVR